MTNENLPLHKQRENWKSHSPRLPADEPQPPPCTSCGHRLILRRIEPAQAGHDIRTYECVRCANVDQHVVRYQTTDPWVLMSVEPALGKPEPRTGARQ